MNTNKMNTGERLALANLARQIRAILRTNNIKGVRVRFLKVCGENVLRLFGTPDDRALAKFAIDAAFWPTR